MIEVLSKPSVSGYSQAAREAIRTRMLAYAKRHKIGVPTLLARMAEATGRSQSQISQKTLQNFLADKSRTNDGFVKICEDFINKAGGLDQGLSLGSALGAFFNEETGLVQPASFAENISTGPVRAMVLVEQPAAGPLLSLPALGPGTFEGMSAAASGPAPRGAAKERLVPYATLTIGPMPHGAFVPVREEVFNWKRVARRRFDESAPRRFYRGYAVMSGEILFVLAKNILTGAARTYWLSGDEKRLSGRAVEMPFLPGMHERGLELDDLHVTYRRKEQG